MAILRVGVQIPRWQGNAAQFLAVLEALEEVMPGFTAWDYGFAWAPATGALKRFTNPELLAQALTEAVAEYCGQECRVGLASGMLTVLLATLKETLEVPDPPGFLAPFPTSALGWAVSRPEERQQLRADLELLQQVGVHTLGQLVHLGQRAMFARLGRRGVNWWTLAAGQDLPHGQLRLTPPQLSVSKEFPEPLTQVSELLFALPSLVEQLFSRCAAFGVRPGEIQMCLLGDKPAKRSWYLGPHSNAGDALVRLRWQVEAWVGKGPSGPLNGVELTAHQLRPLGGAGETLWGHSGRQGDGEQTAARIQSLLGEQSVQAVYEQGGFDPRSRIVLCPFGQKPPRLEPREGPWEGQLVGRAPLWVLPQALPVWLRAENSALLLTPGTAQEARPWPEPLQKYEPPSTLQIVNTAGPYPVDGQWWANQCARSYLWVSPQEGPPLLLLEQEKQWWLEGGG